jgi:hypothetical protein
MPNENNENDNKRHPFVEYRFIYEDKIKPRYISWEAGPGSIVIGKKSQDTKVDGKNVIIPINTQAVVSKMRCVVNDTPSSDD